MGNLERIEIQLLRFCSFETALTESVGTAHAINLQQVKVNNEWAGKARSLHEYFFGNHVNVYMSMCLHCRRNTPPVHLFWSPIFLVPSCPISIRFHHRVAIWTHGCINGIMLREVMSKLWPTLWKVCAERDHLPGKGADPASDPPGSPGEFGGTTCLLGFVKQEVAILTLESVRHTAKHSLKSLRIKHIFHGRMVFFCYMQIRSNTYNRFARTSCSGA